jgi:serine/threonine protein kinase
LALLPLREGDPSRIGRFRLSARLGAGGMGVVYLGTAEDGSQVAVKVLRSELADDAEFRERFRREVSALSRVNGVCTVRVIEADMDSVTPFLATEYANGPSLAEYVAKHGPLGPGLLYGLAIGLAEALTAIHVAGVIHRDLKPANVLLTQEGPKVIDFGIAHALDETAVTRTGMVVGSPGFMAPEQIAGQAGQASDIFAWGLTLAYAASGKPPFGTGPAEVILYRIVHDRPDISAVPEQLRPLVEVAVTKAAAERPAASDLLQQLASAAERPDDPANVTTQVVLSRSWQLPPGIAPAGTAGPVIRIASKRRLRSYAVALSAATLVAAGGGVAAALMYGGSQRPPGPSPATSQHSGTAQVAAARTPSKTAPPSPAPSSPVSSPAPVAAAPPGAGQVGANNIFDLASAKDFVAGLGYGSIGLHTPNWDSFAPLNAVVAFFDAGAASGPGKVFFFVGTPSNSKYVGSDTPEGSSAVGASRLGPTEIQVQYYLYRSGDPQCCPGGGTISVRFSWTGTKLVALDPIPPVSQRT